MSARPLHRDRPVVLHLDRELQVALDAEVGHELLDRRLGLAALALRRDELQLVERNRRQFDAVAGADRQGFLGCIGEGDAVALVRSEEHTSELQSLMRISYAGFCLNKKPN